MHPAVLRASCIVHAFDFNSNSTKLLADIHLQRLYISSHLTVFAKVGGVTVD
jgi:hypothetical protein